MIDMLIKGQDNIKTTYREISGLKMVQRNLYLHCFYISSDSKMPSIGVMLGILALSNNYLFSMVIISVMSRRADLLMNTKSETFFLLFQLKNLISMLPFIWTWHNTRAQYKMATVLTISFLNSSVPFSNGWDLAGAYKYHLIFVYNMILGCC